MSLTSVLSTINAATNAVSTTQMVKGKLLKVSQYEKTSKGEAYLDRDGNPDMLVSLFVQTGPASSDRVNVNFFASRVSASPERFDLDGIQVDENNHLIPADLEAICRKGTKPDSFLASSLVITAHPYEAQAEPQAEDYSA